MGPTDKHILVKILLVKEVVGPVHSAQDPLTDKIPREMCFSINKKKLKKRKMKTQHQKRNPNAYVDYECIWIPFILLKTGN